MAGSQVLRIISWIKTNHAGDDWSRSSMLLKDDKRPWSLSIRDMQLMYQPIKDHEAIANDGLTRSLGRPWAMPTNKEDDKADKEE